MEQLDKDPQPVKTRLGYKLSESVVRSATNDIAKNRMKTQMMGCHSIDREVVR